MKRKLLSLLVLMFIGVQAALAQNDVTGQVVDENSEPLIGASVKVKGSSVGAPTDLDGNFTLKAEPGATLVVSYIGYETREVKVPASGKIKIILENDANQLDGVVVVGVLMKKSDLTGAVSHVDSEVLTQKPVTNINEALQGRVAGVNITRGITPSDDSSIKIRGTNTINSGSSPIYVVDGLVMDNQFGFYNSINVNDVESIEVLKDASATALYGSRGANGVIVITTKKGRKGEGTVSYDGWVSFSTMGHRPETMSAQETFDLRAEAFMNGYIYNNPNSTAAERQAYWDDVIMGSNTVFSDEEFAGYRSGKTYDWLDQVTKTGVEHNHSVSFSKGTDNSSIYLSLGYSGLDGVVKGTEQDKYYGRINAETYIKPWLKIGTNTSYTYVKDDMTDGSVYNMALERSNPLIDYAPYKDDATRHNEDYLTLYWRVRSEENNNYYNPFNSMEIQTERERYHFTSANYININPIKGLNIRSTFAINHAEQSWNQFIPSGIQESIRHKSGDAYATQQRFGDTQWQWDNTISYDTQIKEVHNISAFLGTSASRYVYKVLKGGGKRYASNDLGWNVLGSSADRENRELESDYQTSSLLSYVGRINYNYDYRYFFTFTGRYDGSSKFAKGNRWGFMPSFSVAWDVTNEKFFPQHSFLSRLKVRAGYGVVGNQDISNYQYLTLYYPQQSNGEAFYGTDGRRGTPGITWEKQKQTNIGLDLGFFKNRLNITADLYFITNSNLLMSHSLPKTSGYSYTVENIGELENKGFEMTINATPILTKDFQWNISANLSLDRNKVTKLYGGVTEILNGTDRQGNIFIGESLSNIYTYKSGGIANEDNRELWEGIDYNGRTVGLGDLFVLDISGPDGKPDGVIDQNDRYVYGNTDPKFYGGFSTDFTWKGLTLNAVFNYSVGGHRISSYYESLISSVGLGYASPDLKDHWTEDNTDAYFPRVLTNTEGYNRFGAGETDRYIQSTSYLRLATLTLAYNLPEKWLKHVFMKSARVYFTASNLFTLTGYKGFDPELGDYNYPPTRSYTIGLNFSF
ncbi:putative outer membrane protein probably involved in nutrient binding [Prevotella sp. CAG:1124]|nr:putative outer membrane protein probably involved in nutrient binding [Prevotella sp. CAG:1124]